MRMARKKLLKWGESGPEKASICNGYGAASDEHSGDFAVLEASLEVNAAGAEHLDSLFENDRLPARHLAVTHEVGDGASGGGPGGRILAVVKLHARVPVCA